MRTGIPGGVGKGGRWDQQCVGGGEDAVVSRESVSQAVEGSFSEEALSP